MVNTKRKITVYVDERIWRLFLSRVLARNGRAAGGAISSEVERAIRASIRR
jgi:hypothetical protein